VFLAISSKGVQDTPLRQRIRLNTQHIASAQHPQKTSPTKIVAKKPAGKKVVETQKKASSGSSIIKKIDKIEQQVEKIEKSMQQTPKDLFVTAEPIKEEKNISDYTTSVIQLLQHSVKLLENDAVEVTITVQPNGLVDRICSIESVSLINKRIVESTLLKMVFPPFEGDAAKELSLYLCSEP
jgi:hypothetical protein